MLGPLLEVKMSKKCTPLWREAHLEVKVKKHTILGPLLEVAMSNKCTPLWREAHVLAKNVQNIEDSDHFWTSRYHPDAAKVHAVVMQSTFASKNAQNTSAAEHF